LSGSRRYVRRQLADDELEMEEEDEEEIGEEEIEEEIEEAEEQEEVAGKGEESDEDRFADETFDVASSGDDVGVSFARDVTASSSDEEDVCLSYCELSDGSEGCVTG